MTKAAVFKVKMKKDTWIVVDNLGQELASPQSFARKDRNLAIEFAKTSAFRYAPAIIEVLSETNSLDERVYIDPFNCLSN